jgi:hypothetical protein
MSLGAHTRGWTWLTIDSKHVQKGHNSASGRVHGTHTSAPDAGELGHPQDAGSELPGMHTRIGRAPDACASNHGARAVGGSPRRRRRRRAGRSDAVGGRSARCRRSVRRLQKEKGQD